MSSAVILLVAIASRATAIPAVRRVDPPNDGIVADAEIDDGGVIHLVYASLPDGVQQDIFYVRSEDDGETFADPIRVNTEAGRGYAGGFRGPDIALGADGRVHVAWYTNGYQAKRPAEEWGVHYAYMEADAGAFVAETNINGRPSDNYSIDANGAGEVTIVWTAGDGFVNRSRDGGATFDGAVQITTIDPCECCATRVRYADDGILHLAYREKADNLRDMYIVPITDSLAEPPRVKLDSETWEIAACPMTGSYLTADHGGAHLVAWERKRAVYYGRFATDGSPLAPAEVAVTDAGRYPVVLAAPDGTTLVAWKSDVELSWRRYDAHGEPADEGTTTEADNFHRFAGVVTRGGDFLLFP
ncbi:hypothetical protein CMK11_13705 [Candidatus Poribacteria bacterium]|nr:hypothetical protein [Candidatus Poribacteria bacterium]